MHFSFLKIKLVLGVVELVPLGPIVTNGISKQVSRRVELHGGDGVLAGLESLELRTVVLVPEDESSVATCGCESSVHGVESDVVEGVDLTV